MTNDEKAAAKNRNAELKVQINCNRIVKDRECFQKTEVEREKLAKLSKSWKIRVNGGYHCKTMKLAG
jgi:hypothetical protein